jgi:subtilisin family serine protease
MNYEHKLLQLFFIFFLIFLNKQEQNKFEKKPDLFSDNILPSYEPSNFIKPQFPTKNIFKIAIIDSGVKSTFTDINPLLITHNFTKEKSEFDTFGHGTFTTSLLYNMTPECPGMLNDLINQNQIQLHILKIFNSKQKTSESHLEQALEFCLKNEFSLISLPFGSPTFSSLKIAKLFKKLVYNNTVIVSASGNEGPSFGSLTVPGDSDYVISVGSYYESFAGNKLVSKFSSRGPVLAELNRNYVFKFKPDVLEIGEEIIGSSFKHGKCEKRSGTSLSSIIGKEIYYFSYWKNCKGVL